MFSRWSATLAKARAGRLCCCFSEIDRQSSRPTPFSGSHRVRDRPARGGSNACGLSPSRRQETDHTESHDHVRALPGHRSPTDGGFICGSCRVGAPSEVADGRRPGPVLIAAIGATLLFSEPEPSRPSAGAGWPIVRRPSSPTRDFLPELAPPFATCSSPANRWPTPRPGPTRTAARSPAARAGISSTCRSQRPITTPETAAASGCVVSKIPEFRAILADRNAPRARRRMALRFFVHLVQDLHQPMHVADRNDRGGNNLQLRYGRYDNTNLHQVWDSGLLHQGFRHEDQLVRALEERATQPAARDWLKGGIEDWANESLDVGRRAYLIPGSNAVLRTGAIDRPRLRAGKPPAGRRPRRAVGRPAGRDAQRDLQVSRTCAGSAPVAFA